MENYKNNGHWLSDKPIDPEGLHGFIYCITNLLTGKRYIGRKGFYRKLTKPPLKGKKRRRITYPESSWKTYTGSSDNLNADIAEYGKHNFQFEILFCKPTKGELSYAEANTIHKFDCLTARFEDGSRMFYNNIIPATKFIPKSGGLTLNAVKVLKLRWKNGVKAEQGQWVRISEEETT